MKTLETEHLLLRKWRESDVEDLFEFSKSPNVWPKAGGKVHENIEESRKSVGFFMNSEEVWAIVLKENNKAIGAMFLCDTNRHEDYKEMEYVLSEDYHNKGYMTEAVKCMLEYAFSELNLLIIAICHYPFNVESKRVIEKCGFTYEGTLRKYSRDLEDSVRYSMTKEEWECLYTQ